MLPLQPSLFDGADIELPDPAEPVARTPLAGGAWVDLAHQWIRGSDQLFERLCDRVAWREERRRMFDHVVEVPRLVAFVDEEDDPPDPILGKIRRCLNARYAEELGEPFRTIGLCLYRDGRDSVAWHGDRVGRGRVADTMVAIVSLGTPRRMLLRPARGGPARRFDLGRGDLFVMGGSCQRTWEHSVRKTSCPVGPRISLQFRPRGVR
jgi:alkylated DNA repair dioxygenase AlkB